MEKNEFKAFCKDYFLKRGFKKDKKCFYILGIDMLCSISLQKSDYGAAYYVNYDFFIGDYTDSSTIPDRYYSDIDGRFHILSKSQTINGEYIVTGAIYYEEYTEEELRSCFDEGFEQRILPPLTQGKRYILNNLNKLYHLTLRKEEVLKKLNS